MSRRARVASRLVAIAALIGPVVTTTAAHADVNECAPITIDGQQVACVALSSTPTTQPNGDPGVLVTLTVTIDGQTPVTRDATVTLPVSEVESAVGSTVGQFCVADGQRALPYGQNSGWEAHEFGIGKTDPNYPGYCFGQVGFTVVGAAPSVSSPVVTIGSIQPISEPYHVPQICVTTSPGACVGPYDGVLSPSIPFTGVPPSPVTTYNNGICIGTPPSTSNPSYPFVITDTGAAYYENSDCVID